MDKKSSSQKYQKIIICKKKEMVTVIWLPSLSLFLSTYINRIMLIQLDEFLQLALPIDRLMSL